MRQYRPQIIPFEVLVVGEDLVERHARAEQFEERLDGVAEAAHARLAVADGRVDGDAGEQGVHTRTIPGRVRRRETYNGQLQSQPAPDCVLDVRPPMRLMRRAWATVTTCWASNTPAFRNEAGMFTSNRVACTLVVCGTTVIRTRSRGSVGTLITTHGRTLAAMPRSTIHTDPRSPAGTGGLLGVQGGE